MADGPHIYGLETQDLPDGYTALEAVCVIKCLDDEGRVTLMLRSTSGIMSWEGLGMHEAACEISRARLRSGYDAENGDADG